MLDAEAVAPERLLGQYGLTYEYECECEAGWYGGDCGTECNCDARGTDSCDDGPAGTGACTCLTGFAGLSCDTCNSTYFPEPAGLIKQSECGGRPNPCIGNFCNKQCDPATDCSGQGSCDADGNCACDDGFVGADCSIACDASMDCFGHGVCTSTGTCICDAGWAADGVGNCSTEDTSIGCPADCQNGICAQSQYGGYTCGCLAGYYPGPELDMYSPTASAQFSTVRDSEGNCGTRCTPDETCSGRAQCTGNGTCDPECGGGGFFGADCSGVCDCPAAVRHEMKSVEKCFDLNIFKAEK
jgi:hypothetical protein